MTELAYTVGRTSSYDKCLVDDKPEEMKKLGKRLPGTDFPCGYEGGWVWKTAEEADSFRLNSLNNFEPNWDFKDFSVYEIELTIGWYIDTIFAGEYSNLLVDAPILRKILV